MRNIDELDRRLAALEAMVLGGTRGATAPALDRRLTKAQVAMRRGTSTRTVDRDVERGVLPPPEHENRRCFWWLSKLQEFERGADRRSESAAS